MALIEHELKNAYIGEAPYEGDELCFTANTANSTVQLTQYGTPTAVTLETSADGKSWTTYTIGSTITLSNIGDKVYWRNTSTTDTGFNLNNSNRYLFVMTGSVAGSGDLNYLLNKNSTTTVSNRCFSNLFVSCTSLTTAPELPATTLASYCYSNMFQNCTGLTTAPSLPATTLAERCYNYMFYGCTSLTTVPSTLPATTLATYCYNFMFYGCTGLTTAPQLAATTLADSCCISMFDGCTSLTTAPSLPATTLAYSCYSSMFSGCTNLEKLPKLPATTLTDFCYMAMFSGCSKIKLSTTQTGAYQTAYRIPTTGTGTAGTNSLTNMFTNTGGTFKSAPSINTTYYTSNTVI